MSGDNMTQSSINTRLWILLGVVLLLQLVMMYYTFMKGAKSSTLVERRSSGDNVLPDKKYSLALTPPMGWNSWNVFHCAEEFNEVTIREIADAMVTTGLKDAGYQYINLDDCWQYARDNITGEIQPNPVRFPSGIKALADYVHGKGLKFGLYTDVGSMTCAKWPGSLGYEHLDVQTYAAWGVDFIKNDDCNVPEDDMELGNQTYQTFWQEIKMVNRPIIHSIKSYYTNPVISAEISHMRRVGWDIFEDWGSMMSMVDTAVNMSLWQYSGSGFWNDLDMLEIGNIGLSKEVGLSENENVVHMILWCAFKAPLLLGNDIRKMSPFIKDLLAHDELLAINQDPMGRSVELVETFSPPGGHADRRATSIMCNSTQVKQNWRYINATGQIKSVLNGKCLGLLDIDGKWAAMKDCDNSDPLQLWTFNMTKYNISEIHLKHHPEYCFTMGTRRGAPAIVIDCSLRQHHHWWKGKNKGWYPFNDAFNITYTGKVMQIRNLADECLHAGDKLEIMVFSGPLSEGRHVAVIVNRDDVKHQVSLKRSHIRGLSEIDTVELRDAYKREDLGRLKSKYQTELEGHSALMFVLTVSSRR